MRLRRDRSDFLRCRWYGTEIRADEESFAGTARVLGGREHSSELQAARSVRGSTRQRPRVFISAPRRNYRSQQKKIAPARRRLVLYHSRQLASALRYRDS